MAEHNASTWLVDRLVAEGRGGRTAYRVDGKSTTYQALQREVWRAQNALRSLDIRRGERIALVLDDAPGRSLSIEGAEGANAVPWLSAKRPV